MPKIPENGLSHSSLPAYLRIEVVQKVTDNGEKSMRVATYPVSSPEPPVLPTEEQSGETVSGVQALLWPDGVLRPAGIQPNASENVCQMNGVQYPVYLCLNRNTRQYQELRHEDNAERLKRFGPPPMRR